MIWLAIGINTTWLGLGKDFLKYGFTPSNVENVVSNSGLWLYSHLIPA